MIVCTGCGDKFDLQFCLTCRYQTHYEGCPRCKDCNGRGYIGHDVQLFEDHDCEED